MKFPGWGRLAAACALSLALSACGADDEGGGRSSSQGQEASDETVLPPIGYDDVDLVPGVGEYVREPIDDSVEGTLLTAYVAGDDAVVVYVYRHNPDLDLHDPADHEPLDDAGWTCSSDEVGTSCERALSDGMLTVECNDGPCTLETGALNDVAAMLYEAFSGGSTAGGTTAEPVACEGVDPATVTEAFSAWIPAGEVTVNLADSEPGYVCYLTFPPGSFEESGAELSLFRYAYADDTLLSSSATDFECDFGGTDPDTVFTTAQACIQEADAYDDYSVGVVSVPSNGAGGMVIAQSGVIRAETGDYWWDVSITNVRFDSAYFDALREVASSLPTT